MCTVSRGVSIFNPFLPCSTNWSHQRSSSTPSSGMVVALLAALSSRWKMALNVSRMRERAGAAEWVMCKSGFVRSSHVLAEQRQTSPPSTWLFPFLYLMVSSPSSHSAMALGASLGLSIICTLARIAAISAMYVVSAKG